MRLLFPTPQAQFGPVSIAHAVSGVVLNIFFLSHRYATRKHQLPVQIHSQVQR